MKNLLWGAIVALAMSACAYSGVAANGGQAVVLRNDALLFGMLRKAYVCQITDAGLTSCATSESP
jgi:hypothetical protein